MALTSCPNVREREWVRVFALPSVQEVAMITQPSKVEKVYGERSRELWLIVTLPIE